MYAELYFHAPKIDIGMLSSVRALVSLIITVPVGMFSDRFGRKPAIVLSLSTGLIGLLTMFIAQDISMLIISSAISGIMWATFGPSMQALIADTTEPTKMGKLIGLYTIAPSAGMFIGPFLCSALITFISIRDMFLLASAISIVGLGLCITGIKASEKRFSTSGAMLDGLRSVLRNRNAMAVCLAVSTFFFLNESVFTFYPVYALETLAQQPALISAVFTVRGLALLFSRTLSVTRIVDKVGERKLILFALCLPLTLVLMLFTKNHWISASLLILTGVTHGTVYPMGAMIINKSTTKSERGVANSVYTMLTNVTTMVGPVVVGIMANFLGLAEIFSLLPITTTIGLAIALLFVK
jgi:MFS family permease